ncbi:microtubule-associated protein 1B-like [Gigantopelta aegis]|uniref:microtubule-associated protein 1B-like n=1 Tax=Gigantopelta aegis TaxID=1735272 RepID=UPI001B88DCE2|nr:microtubule-associated protein 1B-like [Gigantopelta aegis]
MATESMLGSETDDLSFSNPAGAALLLIIGEPHSDGHRNLILDEITKGFRCWDEEAIGIDINDELSQIANRAALGNEGPNGERIIRHKSDNIAVEILVNPQTVTVRRSLKSFLTIQSPHKFLIYAGHAFQGSGAWVLQDDVFTFANLAHVFKDTDVENAIKQNPGSNLTVYTLAGSDWRSSFSKHDFCKEIHIAVNPPEKLHNVHGILQFAAYIGSFVKSQNVTTMLHSSEIVGNIKFSRPTLYIFPGCQGDSALFGINGFSLLVNGGYSRRSCFWDFTRHLDRIDAFLLTHLGTDNLFGIGSVLQRKQIENVHPEIGFMYLNSSEKTRNSPLPSAEDVNQKDPGLLINLAEEGSRLIDFSKQLGQLPHPCSRTTSGPNQEPVNLYHKVGHGSLDMYILNPVHDCKELKEFYLQWNKQVNNFGVQQHVPLPNMLSICALLVWRPSNPMDKITRIFFPGNAPQHKVIEGLEKIKNLDFLKHPHCCQKDLQQAKKSPSASRVTGTKTTVRSSAPVKAEPARRTERAERPKPPVPTTMSRGKVVKEDANKKAATRSKDIKKDKEKEKKEKTDKSKSSASSSPSKSSVSAASPSKSLTPTDVLPEPILPQEKPESPVKSEPEPEPTLQDTSAKEQPLINHVSEQAPVTESEQLSNSVNEVRESASPEPLPDPTQFEPTTYDNVQQSPSQPLFDKQRLIELGIYDDDYEESEPAVPNAISDKQKLEDMGIYDDDHQEDVSSAVDPISQNHHTPVTSPLSPGDEDLLQPQALPDPVAILEQAPLIPEKDFMRDVTPEGVTKEEVEPEETRAESPARVMEAEEKEKSPAPCDDSMSKGDSSAPFYDNTKEDFPAIYDDDTKDDSPAPCYGDTKDESPAPFEDDTKDDSPAPGYGDTKEDSPAPCDDDTKDDSPAPGYGDTKEDSPAPCDDDTKDDSPAPSYGDKKEDSPAPCDDDTKDDSPAPGYGDTKEASPAPCDDDIKEHYDDKKAESPVPVYNDLAEKEESLVAGHEDPAEDIPSSPEPTEDPQEFAYPSEPAKKEESSAPFIHEPDVTPAQASIEQSLQYGITDDQIPHMGGIREEEEEDDAIHNESIDDKDHLINIAEDTMHPTEQDSDIKAEGDHVNEADKTMERETDLVDKQAMEDLGISEEDDQEVDTRDSLERDPSAFVYEKEVDLEEEEGQVINQEENIRPDFDRETHDEMHQMKTDAQDEAQDENASACFSKEQDSVTEHNHIKAEESQVAHDLSYDGSAHEMEGEQESSIPEAFEKDDTPQPRENQPFDFSGGLIENVNGTGKMGDKDDDTDSIDGGTPDDDKDIDESFSHIQEKHSKDAPTPEMENDVPANMRAGFDSKNPFDTLDQQGYNPFIGIEDTGSAQQPPANMAGIEQESALEANKEFDPVAEWGQPMGLPSPSPPEENKSDVATNGIASDVSSKSPKAAKTAKNGTTKMADAKKSPPRTKSPEKRPASATKTRSANGLTNKSTDLHTRTGRPGSVAADKKTETKRPATASTEKKPATARARPATAPALRQTDSKTRATATSRRPATATSRSSPVNSRAAPLPPLTPFYVDLTYIPNHGDPLYSDVEFFKRIRARHYVLSSLSPNPQILNSLLEAKRLWEDKELEVTVIPTYDNETLRHWMGLHKEDLGQLKIDVAPSASRCTIQLQDHETSCSAYRLEF